MMRVESAPLPGTAKGDGWMVGWHRVADDDGSTVAYCPDAATAQAFLRAEEIRRLLQDVLDAADQRVLIEHGAGRECSLCDVLRDTRAFLHGREETP